MGDLKICTHFDENSEICRNPGCPKREGNGCRKNGMIPNVAKEYRVVNGEDQDDPFMKNWLGK